MSSTLIAGIVVVVIAILVLVDRFVLHRRRQSPDAEMRVLNAWEQYFDHPERLEKRDRLAINLFSQKPELANRCRKALEDLEDRLGLPGSLRGYRKAIIDAADGFLFEDFLMEKEGSHEPSEEYAENVVTAGVLRLLLKERFGDYAERDWYSHYLVMANMNLKNVHGMIQKTTSGGSPVLETALHEHLTSTMADTRDYLLDHPPGTPVQKGHTLKVNQEAPRKALSERQIESLTALMKGRFEKLFGGQLYQWLDGPSVSPSGAFTLDCGLLYTLLVQRFPKAPDAWSNLLNSSLGGEAFDSEKLLERARSYHDIWISNEADGPLQAVLREAVGEAYEFGAGEAGRREAVALHMSNDAMVLVRDIRRILDE